MAKHNLRDPLLLNETASEDAQAARMQGSQPAEPKPSTELNIAAACGAIGGFQFGYQIGVVNTPKANIQAFFEDHSVAGFSLCVALLILGGLFGSQTGNLLTDKFGRRWGFAIFNVPLILGSVVQASASALWVITVGRFIAGYSCGAFTVLVPTYMQELAPRKLSGRYGSFTQMGITFGVLLSFLLGLAFVNTEPHPKKSDLNGWRYMFALPALVGVIQVVCCLFNVISETPAWYLRKGDRESALAALCRNRVGTRAETDWELQDDEEDLKTNSSGHAKELSFFDLFRPPTVRATIIGIVAMVCQQMSGVNAVIAFSTAIFETSLCDTHGGALHSCSGAIVATQIVGILNFFLSIVTSAFLDGWGRKKILVWGTVAMFVSLSILTITMYSSTNAAADWIGIVSIWLFVIWFAGSAGPIPWVIVTEILPSDAKALGVPFLVSVNWMSNLIVTLTFLPMKQAMGAGTFIPYIVILGFVFAILYRNLPETKGCSPDEVQRRLSQMPWP